MQVFIQGCYTVTTNMTLCNLFFCIALTSLTLAASSLKLIKPITLFEYRCENYATAKITFLINICSPVALMECFMSLLRH